MAERMTWMFGALVVFAACDGDESSWSDEADGELSLREAHSNGFNLNGFNLNGFNLNGFNLNGFNLNGDAGTTDTIRSTDFAYGGGGVPDIWLEGSELFLQSGNKVKSGADINKLKIKFDVTESGSTRKKTVSFKHAAPLAPGSDVWVYDADLKDGGGPWEPLCVDGLGARTEVFVLAGVWNPGTGDRRAAAPYSVTAACRGAALAKCVEWGYKPWASAGGESLYDYHQACTRMIRADYCGDGVSHTVDGTPIHVLDELGVQNVDPNVTYAVEAEWGPDGAVCLNAANTRLPGVSLACQLPACGGSFSSGGLIQSGKILAGP